MDARAKTSSFKDLIVWQRSIDLVEKVYKITKKFPEEERFGLISQIRRACVSVSSNIAEGNGRRTRKDYIQFLHIALGSLAELETQLVIAKRLSYVENLPYNGVIEELVVVRKILIGLISSLTTHP